MQADRTADVAEGNRLIQALGEVMPAEAPDRVRRIYLSSQQTLRVPFVNFIFRVLANHPDYLETAWTSLQPQLTTRAFERSADALRALAVPEDSRPGNGRDWGALGDLRQIRPLSDSIYEVLPKLLLIVTAWDEALVRDSTTTHAAKNPAAASPRAEGAAQAIADGTADVELLDPGQAGDRVGAIFTDIQKSHGHPGVASYYRALGRWPDFLDAVWQHVKPLIDTPFNRRRKEQLINEAHTAALNLPLSGPQVQDPREAAELRNILAVFRFKLIPDLLMDVAAVRHLLDNLDSARHAAME